MKEQLAFQIDRADNVCTVLGPVAPGTVRITGESDQESLQVLSEIPKGHKIALRRINEGQSVIKYGVEIGIATRNIEPGEWVHLHNCRSRYDERSSTLDVMSGAPTDTPYL